MCTGPALTTDAQIDLKLMVKFKHPIIEVLVFCIDKIGPLVS